MKLWELVPCWGQPSRTTPIAPPSSPSFIEENQLLTVTATPSKLGSKSNRRCGSGSWRPSLGAIGEDYAAASTVASPARRRSVDGAAGKRRPVRSASSRQHGRESYGHMAVVVPSFTPTAFLF